MRLFHQQSVRSVLVSLVMSTLGCGLEAYDAQGLGDPGSLRQELATSTPAMPEPLSRFAIGRLADGRVLAAGGRTMGPTKETPWVRSAYLFDPVTDSWSPTGPLSRARVDARAVVLGNGKMLVIGGSSDAATTELYDPTTGTFSPHATMTVHREDFTATLLRDGRVLVVGGRGGTGSTGILSSAEVYDPSNQTFVALTGTMRVPRSGHTATLLSDGRVLIVGGASTPATEIFNPGTGTFFAGGELLDARTQGHTATILSTGHVLVAGGRNTGPLSGVELYDPSTNSWQRFPSLSTARSHHTAGVTSGGTIYVFGGKVDSEAYESAGMDSVEQFQISPTKPPLWTKAESLVDGRHSQATVSLLDGRLLIAGGESYLSTTSPHWTLIRQSSELRDDVPCESFRPGGVTATYNTGEPDAGLGAPLGAPQCNVVGSSCDSVGLLNGRANIPNGVEPNQPNTIQNSCADGTSGKYHSDESIDAIRVSNPDGTALRAGQTAQVQVTVWAYSLDDKLDLYYTGDARTPGWTFLTTLTPSAAGVQTLSATYTLPAGSLQAIRGNFRWRGIAASCTTGDFNDHDDLIFAVSEASCGRPSTRPTAPASGSVVRGVVSLGASAESTYGVTDVDFLQGNRLLGTDTTAPYTATWDTRTLPDSKYVLTTVAHGADGKVGRSQEVVVRVDNTAPTLSMLTANGITVSGLLPIRAEASDQDQVATVSFFANGVALGNAQQTGSRLELLEIRTYQLDWNTDTVPPGTYVLTAVATDRAGNTTTSPGITVNVVARGTAWYSADIKAPWCSSASSSCGSGALLTGRSNLGPEPNMSNTIDGCSDGTSGIFHTDESLDSLFIQTTQGEYLGPGKEVRVKATVWAFSYYQDNALDLFVAPDPRRPVWSLVATLPATQSGSQVLSTIFTLPATTTSTMALRGSFRYQGSSTTACPIGGFNDRDDLVFSVIP